MLEIHRFDPTDCRFPPPRVPVLPFRPPPVHPALGARPRADGPLRQYWHFRRGRYALHRAYRLAGVSGTRALLVPAYHCRTMLDAALVFGGRVALYPVQAGLQPDLEGLADLVRSLTEPPAALLVSHYFGFAQDLGPLADFCRTHGIEMIEDCAHCFVLDPALAGPDLGAIGATARIGISSPYKFLPCPDGGLLWVQGDLVTRHATPVRPGLADELRGWLTLARQWRAARRRIDLPTTTVASAETAGRGRHWIEPLAGPSQQYLAAQQDQAALSSSRWVARRCDVQQVADRRRMRYQQWLAACTGLDGARPLFSVLPDGTVPYMFPLLLDRTEPAFHQLKSAGLPIWRWDEMARSPCPVASAYRERLWHLPCHQDLDDVQMGWMTGLVRQALGARV